MRITGKEKVLVCPLGWGLGHASRSVVVIEFLLKKGCRVAVAADKTQCSFIKSRYPELEFIHFPSYGVKFSSGSNQLFPLIRIAFKMIYRTTSEHFEVKKLIKTYDIDLIIADNRFGLYSKKIPSIFITNQLSVRFPKPFQGFKPIGEWFVKRHAERFTQCWIPDNPSGISISGELTNPVKMTKNAVRVGLMSRFAGDEAQKRIQEWDLLTIISGPPPHREIMQNEVEILAKRLQLKTLILQGIPQSEENSTIRDNITFVSNLPDKEIAKAICTAKYIICRSGFSTITDLLALKRNAILVPTPGQTEQEYLCKHLSGLNYFTTYSQHEIHALEIKQLVIADDNVTTREAVFFPLEQF